MTPQEFKEKMVLILPPNIYDKEAAHLEADRLMCEILSALGYGDGVAIFETADLWYA